MDTKEALITALNNEKIGYNMYLEASANSNTKQVSEFFSHLAVQELNHIKKIESYEGLSVVYEEELSAHMQNFDETKYLFKKTVAEWKSEFNNSEDLEVLRKALEFEKEGYHFYKEQSEDSKDKKLVDFFKFLMKEEDVHFHFIQNMLNYLENPVQFNIDEEDWFFEG